MVSVLALLIVSYLFTYTKCSVEDDSAFIRNLFGDFEKELQEANQIIKSLKDQISRKDESIQVLERGRANSQYEFQCLQMTSGQKTEMNDSRCVDSVHIHLPKWVFFIIISCTGVLVIFLIAMFVCCWRRGKSVESASTKKLVKSLSPEPKLETTSGPPMITKPIDEWKTIKMFENGKPAKCLRKFLRKCAFVDLELLAGFFYWKWGQSGYKIR